jgi:hypothetical protein
MKRHHEKPQYLVLKKKVDTRYSARGRFVSFMKKADIGSKGYGGGYRISYYDIMPQDHQYRSTQSLDIKEVATEAFRDELKKYGLTVYAESRAD